jgi:hypothetical protein
MIRPMIKEKGKMTDKEKAVAMAYTGVAMLTGEKLGIFYEYVGGLLGRSIFTHELADANVWELIKEKSKGDFIRLCEEENRPQGEWITFDELRGWLTAQGFSSGTVEDKVKEFKRYIERAREDE